MLTVGWYVRFWWQVEEMHSNCTAKQIESVLAFTLAVTDETFVSDVSLTTTPGIVSGSTSSIITSELYGHDHYYVSLWGVQWNI